MSDGTSSRLVDNVRRTATNHGMNPYIQLIAASDTPRPHVDVQCSDRQHCQAIAALLAGSGPTAERVDDNGLGARHYTIIIVGAPIDVSWWEFYTPPQVRGARPERRHTGPGATSNPETVNRDALSSA